MAKYVTTTTVTVYNTVEEAATGLASALHLIDTGSTANLKCDIHRIESNKYAAWVVYTDVA